MNTTLSTEKESAKPGFTLLNILYGIAIPGLLVTSIWAFAGFTPNEQAFYINGLHGGNYKILALVSIFFEGKMLALLGIAFGAGIILFLEKEMVAGGIKAEEAYIRRQLWFIAFGLFTALVILWPDELMFPFGVVGILLFAFWKMPAKGFFIAAFVCLLIYSGKTYWNYA
jgi:uncharacterized protein